MTDVKQELRDDPGRGAQSARSGAAAAARAG